MEGNPITFVDPLGLQTTVENWCRQNPLACAEIILPTVKPPNVTPTDSAIPVEDNPEQCPPNDPNDDGCKKASDWQLDTLGIDDPHSFKRDYVGGSLSKYDICICKGGAVKLKGAGKCGKPGPSIPTY